MIVPEVKTLQIEVPQYLIKLDVDAKLELTEKERMAIRNNVVGEFKMRIEELEANILAYQDLLITKEGDINELNEKLSKILEIDFSVQTNETIIEL